VNIFGVFRVKNHDFTPKKSYFFPILGVHAPGAPPPGSAPGLTLAPVYVLGKKMHISVSYLK
jgi:hypothetical protein